MRPQAIDLDSPNCYRPLRNIITFDDFDTGYNGWQDLTPNFVYDDYSSFQSVVDLEHWAPIMLSTASMRYASSHGSMHGNYSLKLSTYPVANRYEMPPAPGSMGCAVKRLSFFSIRRYIQIETWFSYTPQQDRPGIGEEAIRAFGFYFDIQDSASRYQPGVRYVNSVNGTLAKRWQYWRVRDGVTPHQWNYGIKDGWCKPGIDNLWYGRRYSDGSTDGFTWIDNGHQDLIFNESPDKINWMYLRLLVDVQRREYVELQSMDKVFDLRGVSPTLVPKYDRIDYLLNPIFFVEADTNRSVNFFLDSVMYSTD